MAQPKINPDLVKQILTLRYSTTIESKIPTANWKDFTPKKKNRSTKVVAKIIENNIKKNIKNNAVISLSGGIDSTLVLHFLKKVRPDASIKAILVRFEQSEDETKIASRIANRFDIDYEILPIKNYLLELPKAISIVKLPLWDLHWYYVAKRATKFSKVILSGDGGDELFGGYTFRYDKFLSLVKKDASTKQKILAYLECHQRDWVPDQEMLFNTKAQFSWNKIYAMFEPYFDNPLNPISQVFLADFNGKLRHNFSIVSQRINSHFKLKTVSPLLSADLIDYATHTPLDAKYDKRHNIGKLLLREILTKAKLDKYVSKKKQGFSVDTKKLWHLHAKKICDYYLSDARIVRDKWINQDWINMYLHRKNLDQRYVNKFLGLLSFEIWYRLFITKEMKNTTLLDF